MRLVLLYSLKDWPEECPIPACKSSAACRKQAKTPKPADSFAHANAKDKLARPRYHFEITTISLKPSFFGFFGIILLCAYQLAPGLLW
ncbi:hypothetical protein [Thalassospira tepidiphila]|uniref:hypothetical protein n=1 Tax=Thalassospira tepidiphila TaxID=393657 RepID=UPI0030C7644B